jgi:hypothetical protein
MKDRITCVVPFCRRTRGDRKGDPITPDMEWICGDHWRLVERNRRRAYGRHRRRWRRFSPEGAEDRATWRLWSWLKRRAIERAAGL